MEGGRVKPKRKSSRHASKQAREQSTIVTLKLGAWRNIQRIASTPGPSAPSPGRSPTVPAPVQHEPTGGEKGETEIKRENRERGRGEKEQGPIRPSVHPSIHPSIHPSCPVASLLFTPVSWKGPHTPPPLHPTVAWGGGQHSFVLSYYLLHTS